MSFTITQNVIKIDVAHHLFHTMSPNEPFAAILPSVYMYTR